MGNSSSVKFGKKTTATEVAEFYDRAAEGKYVVVTGGNIGLGLETARVLAKAGSNVVIACRSPSNGAQAVATIKAQHPNVKVSTMTLDLASFSSIRKFVADYKATGNPLHLLINNAGVMGLPKGLTSDGLELQFGINHIGHFLLTTELLDVIKASGTAEAPARIVNVSSHLNKICSPRKGIRFDDLNSDKYYNQWQGYGTSKIANILFAKQLQRIFEKERAHVVSVSLHPGIISDTGLLRHTGNSVPFSLLWMILGNGPGAFIEASGDNKTIPQGAATTVYAALAPEVLQHGGAYFSNCAVDTQHVHASANSAKAAQDLWTASERIVGK